MAGTGKSIGVALPTRALQSRDVLRQTVVRAQVLAREGNRLRLSAQEKTAHFRPLSSADQAMFAARAEARAGAATVGEITVDVLHERVFRVRYRQRDANPPAASGLLAGEFPSPVACDWQVHAGRIEARTQAGTLVLHLDPWRWEWRSPEGRTVCAAAGSRPEAVTSIAVRTSPDAASWRATAHRIRSAREWCRWSHRARDCGWLAAR